MKRRDQQEAPYSGNYQRLLLGLWSPQAVAQTRTPLNGH